MATNSFSRSFRTRDAVAWEYLFTDASGCRAGHVGSAPQSWLPPVRAGIGAVWLHYRAILALSFHLSACQALARARGLNYPHAAAARSTYRGSVPRAFRQYRYTWAPSIGGGRCDPVAPGRLQGRRCPASVTGNDHQDDGQRKGVCPAPPRRARRSLPRLAPYLHSSSGADLSHTLQPLTRLHDSAP
jgi:hypothetical protein